MHLVTLTCGHPQQTRDEVAVGNMVFCTHCDANSCVAVIHVAMPGRPKLYPYQQSAITRLLEAYANGEDLVIQAPRGIGKAIVDEWRRVHRPELFAGKPAPPRVCSWLIREDVAEAVVDAFALLNTTPDYDSNPFDFLGWSDPVHLERM